MADVLKATVFIFVVGTITALLMKAKGKLVWSIILGCLLIAGIISIMRFLNEDGGER